MTFRSFWKHRFQPLYRQRCGRTNFEPKLEGLKTPYKSRSVSLCPAFERMREMRGKFDCQELAGPRIRDRMQRVWTFKQCCFDLSFLRALV